MKQSLDYHAAKLAVGKLSADEIKSTIHGLVDEGLYLDEFLDALDADMRPRMDEVLPALLAALTHEGIALPEKEQAVWYLIEFHLKRIAGESVDPIEELGKLIADVYWDYDFHAQTIKYLGDSHGIAQLIGLYWEADDLREYPEDLSRKRKYRKDAWPELKRQIVIEAKQWMASRHPAR